MSLANGVWLGWIHHLPTAPRRLAVDGGVAAGGDHADAVGGPYVAGIVESSSSSWPKRKRHAGGEVAEAEDGASRREGEFDGLDLPGRSRGECPRRCPHRSAAWHASK